MKNYLKKSITVLAVLVIGIGMFVGCSKNSRNKVVIQGSTTVLPITQKAVEEYRKLNNISISVSGTGSGNGIKSLIDGNCDIANSSREMKDDEKKLASDKGLTLKEIVVAYDMIVPVVNPANPVKNLSLAQLKGIYDGSITNWKEVGGKNETIVVISRDTSSGTYEVWESKIMKKTDVRKDALLQASNGAVSSSVSQNPKAIGYIGFGYIDSSVKGLYVENIEPTLENGKSGKYPVSRKLYMYINSSKIKPQAQGFIDYLLSPAGQEVVKSAGFIQL